MGSSAPVRLPGLLLAIAIAAGTSCTRMPTAPRFPVTVEGRISGPSGESLQGASVFFGPAEAVWTGFGSAETDSLGHYTVTVLTGTYRVSVYAPDDYGAPVHEARVTFTESQGRFDYRFQGFRVTGRVTGPTGTPIDSGYVSARSPVLGYEGAISTLRSGTFSFLLPAGTYSFFASDADTWSGLPRRSISGVAITADTTMDIELGGVPVSGHVYGPGGLPMAGATIRIGYLVQNITKSDGGYLLYIPPGTYQIFFQPPYPFFIFPRVTAPVAISAPISIDGDLSGVEWTGTIRRIGTGESVAGVGIVVTQVGDEVYRSAAISSGPQGEFRFVLERDRPYDLKTYDAAIDQWTTPLAAVAATADSTFDVLVP